MAREQRIVLVMDGGGWRPKAIMGIVLGYRDCWCVLNDSMNKFLLLLSVDLALWSSTSIHAWQTILGACYFYPCYWALGCRGRRRVWFLLSPQEPLKTKCSNKTEQNKWQNHMGKCLFSQRCLKRLIPPHAEEEVRDGFTKEVVFGPSRITMNAASRRRGGSRASTTTEAGRANRERPRR